MYSGFTPWTLDSWDWIRDSGFWRPCQWNLDSGFQSSRVFRIPWAQFNKQDFTIWIFLHGATHFMFFKILLVALNCTKYSVWRRILITPFLSMQGHNYELKHTLPTPCYGQLSMRKVLVMHTAELVVCASVDIVVLSFNTALGRLR